MSRARSYSNLGAADGGVHRQVPFSHSRKPAPRVCHQPSLDTPLQISAGRLRCANCPPPPISELPVKPPVVHQSVRPPTPNADREPAADSGDAGHESDPRRQEEAPEQVLVGSYGPLVRGRSSTDKEGASSGECKKPDPIKVLLMLSDGLPSDGPSPAGSLTLFSFRASGLDRGHSH